MQQQGPDRNAVQQAFQGVVAAFAEQKAVLADCGQRRRGVGADRKVIEADDADIFRNPEVHLLALDHCRVCDLVVAADDGGHLLLVQKAGQIFFHAVGDIVGASGQGLVSKKPLTAHGLEEGFPPHLHDMGIQGVA